MNYEFDATERSNKRDKNVIDDSVSERDFKSDIYFIEIHQRRSSVE